MCVFGPPQEFGRRKPRDHQPSEFTPRTYALLARLIAETFHPSEVAIVPR